MYVGNEEIIMDFSIFSSENFSAKQWINTVLNKKADVTENEALLQAMVVELQTQIEKVNTIIEENCEQITDSIPQIISDTEILNGKVLVFAEKLQNVKQEIENIDKNTDDSVSKLKKIDHWKTTLEGVKQALHEADNWSILTSDIEECFDQENIDKVTSILVSLQQSLNVLSNADDYEDKKMQLEGLKNRLEATVSPNVVKAFTTHSHGESLKFVKIFQDIERLPQLLKYYIKCQKCSMCQYWKSLIDSEPDSNLTEQLRSLYDMLLLNWQKEIRWCKEVFVSTKMTDMMIELYAETLLDLDPSINSCMDISLKQHAQPLLLLLEYYQSSRQFQKNLESLYVFNNESCKFPQWKPIVKSIYFPYTTYTCKYGTLERQLLDLYLWDCFSKLVSETDIIDYIRNIGLTIPTVMNAAREAESRCIEFTNGCVLNGLILALKGYFLKYIDKYKDICERLSQQISNTENFSILTSCLSFQQIIGEFLTEIRKFESHLEQLCESYKRNPDVKENASIILSPAGQKDFENWLNNVLNDSSPSLMHHVISAMEKVAYDVHQISYKVSFQPIYFHLESIKELQTKLNCDDRDLPDYSYSPLEYITQIGEHMITLPQYLEPFLSQENAPLNSVLEIISKDTKSISADKGTYANVLLALVAQGTCQAYTDQILNIRELNPSAVRQFAADINYLANVLEELGIGLTEDLQNILQLLRLPAEEYQAKSIGFPPRLVAAIRQTRKLQST